MTDPKALQAGLIAIDTHVDIPWPEAPAAPRQVDLAQLRAGALAGACFAAYVPQTPAEPAGEAAAFARAEAMLCSIRAFAEAGGGRFATTAGEIAAAWREGMPAVIPCVENGHAVGRDLERLAHLRRLGAVYLTLTHNGHNALADSAIPRPALGDPPAAHGGLSPLGQAAIAAMNRLGILVDVSHAAPSTLMQAAAASRTPVIATHSCCGALCPHPRNLDDPELDVLAAVGGVIQITAMPAFLRPGGKQETVGVADLVDHVDYAVRRIGISHVGLSSDFDGGGGVSGWANAAESPEVTAELLRRGYDRAAIAALWGGNFLRLVRRAEEIAVTIA